MIEITYLPLINAPNSFRRMSLDDAIAEVKTAKHNGKVDAARMEFLENGKSIEYKTLKDKLPSYIFAGTFDKKVSNDSLAKASGIFNVDIDGLGYEAAKECKTFLSSIPECIFAFLSPSADGVKAGIRIGTVANDFEYKQYFEPVQALLGKYQNDKSVKDIRRACYVSTDPDVFYNPDAVPLVIALSEPKPKEVSVYVKPDNSKDDDVLKALDYLSSDDYHDWIKYGQALKAGGYDFEVFANWSSKYKDYDYDKALKKWDSFNASSITIATIVYDAMQKGFVKSGREINYDDFPDSEEPAAITGDVISEDDEFWIKINQAIDVLNRNHHFITEGGKSFILRTTVNFQGEEVISYLRKDAFLDSYANKLFIVGFDAKGFPKKETLGKLWFTSPRRSQYINGVFFQPAKEGIPSLPLCLNLWRGFAYPPVQSTDKTIIEQVNLIRDLFLNVICNGIADYYLYFIKWVAWGFQNPEKQAGVAVVMRGEKGIGKGTVGKLLLRLWGVHAMPLNSAKHLTGNFNAHLINKTFIFADEAFFAGDRSQENVLKGIVTEDYFTAEKKNIDAQKEINRLKILMSSNSDFVVPSGKDERRWFVLDVPSTKKGEWDYWDRLNKAIADKDVLKAFMHDLQSMDLSDFRITAYPETIGNKHQRFHSLCPVGQYFADCLQRGYLYETFGNIGSDKWEGDISPRVSTALVHAGFLQWAKEHGKSGWDRVSQKQLGTYFEKIGFTKSVQRGGIVISDGSKTQSLTAGTCLTIGTLLEAAKKFCDAEKINLADFYAENDDFSDMDFSDLAS